MERSLVSDLISSIVNFLILRPGGRVQHTINLKSHNIGDIKLFFLFKFEKGNIDFFFLLSVQKRFHFKGWNLTWKKTNYFGDSSINYKGYFKETLLIYYIVKKVVVGNFLNCSIRAIYVISVYTAKKNNSGYQGRIQGEGVPSLNPR